MKTRTEGRAVDRSVNSGLVSLLCLNTVVPASRCGPTVIVPGQTAVRGQSTGHREDAAVWSRAPDNECPTQEGARQERCQQETTTGTVLVKHCLVH